MSFAVVTPTCKTCGGSVIERTLDGPACLQCGRLADPPRPPLWLLQADPSQDQDTRIVNMVTRRAARAIRAEAAAVSRVTYDEMRAAMAVLR